MKYDSALDQQSISGKIVSLILCVWKPCYVKSGHISSIIKCFDYLKLFSVIVLMLLLHATRKTYTSFNRVCMH